MSFAYISSILKNVTIRDRVYDVSYKGGKLLKCNDKKITQCKIVPYTNEICDEAFADCTELETIIIPDTVKVIGSKAFSNCTKLKNWFISHKWVKIDQSSSNEYILTIPDNVTTIKEYAFCNCAEFRYVNLGKNMSEISTGLFQGCKGLGSIRFNSGVGEIGQDAFRDCKNLGMANIPGNVKTIDQCAFYGCGSLTHLNIGSGVVQIKNRAFAGCKELMEIGIRRLNPPKCDADVFSGVSQENTHLFVPIGSKKTYSEAYVWKDFKNITEEAMNLRESVENKNN